MLGAYEDVNLHGKGDCADVIKLRAFISICHFTYIIDKTDNTYQNMNLQIFDKQLPFLYILPLLLGRDSFW